MPRLSQGRVRPITGEIYFLCPEGEGDLTSLLKVLGLASGDDGDGGSNDGGGGQTAHNRFSAITGTLNSGFKVKASVLNAYGGPALDALPSYPPLSVAAIVQVSTAARPLVGHPIMVYSIPQIVYVTYPASIANGGIFLDNYPVNRTNFRLVRGIQNEIRFYIRDVDRKPVPVANSESFTIHIVDIATNTLLMSRNLTTMDNNQGIYLLTILPSEMDAWATGPARWSLMYNRSDGSQVLMWTDRGYSPYSTCEITEGPIPGPAPTITVDTAQLTMMIDGNLYTPALPGASAHGFVGGVQTFAIKMTGLTGYVRIDASLATEPVNTPFSSDWFEVDLLTYTLKTGIVILNEVGNFLWMRVVIRATAGLVNQIQYRG